MAQEIYLIEEVQEIVTDVEKNEEWKRLVKELGLSGQEELLVLPDKSPIPFPIMNEKMQRVYQTLCPTHVELSKFNETTIPIRVLSVLALCKQEGYFGRIEVWSDNEKPDPIAVGRTDPNEYSSKPMYIVARWGDELRSFPELQQLATQRLIKEKTADFQEQIAKHTTAVAGIESHVSQWLNGKWVQPW